MTTTGDTDVTATMHAYLPTTTRARLTVTSFTPQGAGEHIALGIHHPGEPVELHALPPDVARELAHALLTATS